MHDMFCVIDLYLDNLKACLCNGVGYVLLSMPLHVLYTDGLIDCTYMQDELVDISG